MVGLWTYVAWGAIGGFMMSGILLGSYLVWTARAPGETEGAVLAVIWIAAILGAPIGLAVAGLVVVGAALIPLPPVSGPLVLLSIPFNWALVGAYLDQKSDRRPT